MRILGSALLIVAFVGCGGGGGDTGTDPGTVVCDPPCPMGQRCDPKAGCVAMQAGADFAVAPHDMAVTCDPLCGGTVPYCNAQHTCVQCLMDSHCPLGQICKVVGSSAACVPGCNDDSRCPGGGGGGDGGAPGAMKCCRGACIDTSRDPFNCGGCGTTCTGQHAGASCVAGACTNGSCASGWADCNMDPKDGCEVKLDFDASNCGACGMKCAIANAISGCGPAPQGMSGCYIQACNFGFDDCNGDVKDGCETSVLSDVKNCGGCAMPCAVAAHAKVGCINATCGLTSCDVGWADCDGLEKNGCEVAVGSDRNNCGKCGAACGMGQVCINGGCTCANCNIANASTKCVNNMCVFDQCVQGFGDCDNNINNGCETDLTQDPQNCNACGNVCPMNAMVCANAMCTNVPNMPFFSSMPGQPTGSTQRANGFACGTVANVNQNHNVFLMAAYLTIPAPTAIKFIIFSHPAHVQLFTTPEKMYQAQAAGWVKSDVFQAPFTIQAGQAYDFAATVQQTATYGYDQQPDNMNGVQSLSQNPNWNNYAQPVVTGHAGVDCGIQLY
jgi:hypothetical protein